MLTGLDNAYTAGSAKTVSLNKTTMKTQLGITDAYWADVTNWRRVAIMFKNSYGQNTTLSFVGSSSDSFKTGLKAINGTWEMFKVLISDTEGSVYEIQRGEYQGIFSSHDVTLSGGITV